MKKVGILALLLILVISSCKNTKPETTVTESSRWSFDTLHIEKKIYMDNDSAKSALTLTLEFDYPSKFDNDTILKAVQEHFVSYFTEDEDGTYRGLDPVAGFNAFVDNNVAESIKLGKAAEGSEIDFSEYYKTVKTTVTDTTAVTITGRTEVTQYSGGAHDSHYVDYFTVDLRNGKLLELDELLNGDDASKQLLVLIKEVLNTTKNANGDPLSLFDPTTITPSPNFYFAKQGIVFVYNTYEIAPHSDGLIEVTIPYAKIKALVAGPYQELIAQKIKTE